KERTPVFPVDIFPSVFFLNFSWRFSSETGDFELLRCLLSFILLELSELGLPCFEPLDFLESDSSLEAERRRFFGERSPGKPYCSLLWLTVICLCFCGSWGTNGIGFCSRLFNENERDDGIDVGMKTGE